MPKERTLNENFPGGLKAEPYYVPEQDVSLDELFAMEREMTARKAMEALGLPELIEFYRTRAEDLQRKEKTIPLIPGGANVEEDRMLRMMFLNKLTGGSPLKAKEAYEMAFPKPDKDLRKK